jgi:hypothetical protein
MTKKEEDDKEKDTKVDIMPDEETEMKEPGKDETPEQKKKREEEEAAKAAKAALDAKDKKLAEDKKPIEDKKPFVKCAELDNVEIFATGTHRDRTFTEADLNTIADNFKRFGEKLKPPMVLGHDEKQTILQNSGLPALGWLKHVEVKKKGDGAVLVAKFDDVPEAAITAVKAGRYKRISAELYQNFMDGGKAFGLALRRVALLGADVPEVKTLADVAAMSENDNVITVFSDEGGTKMAEDHAGLVGRVAELEKRNQELTAELAKESVEKHRASISSFCEELKREGRFLPRWQEMGISRFLETLTDSKPMKFSEAKEAKELSPLGWMKEFMRGLPQIVKLEEIATQNPDLIANMKAEGESKSKMLDKATQVHLADELKKGRSMTYVEAVREVAKANPALVE